VLVTRGLVKKISFPAYCTRTTAAPYNVIIKYAQSAGARTEAAHAAAAGNRPTGTRDRGGGAASAAAAAADLQMLREIIVSSHMGRVRRRPSPPSRRATRRTHPPNHPPAAHAAHIHNIFDIA